MESHVEPALLPHRAAMGGQRYRRNAMRSWILLVGVVLALAALPLSTQVVTVQSRTPCAKTFASGTLRLALGLPVRGSE